MSSPEMEKDEVENSGVGPNSLNPAYELDHDADFGGIEADIRHEILSGRINDPNIDPQLVHEADQALAKGDEKAELRLEDVIEDDSIYPEVRAAVSNTDDPSMRANTFRAWIMGMIACTVLSGINMYFSPQWPSVSFPSIAVQLFAYPIGVAMAKIPYPRNWPLADWINPGPFNIKEHTMISVMSSVSVGSAYSTDIFIVQHAYYRQHLSGGYMILLTLATQLIGFSFAGFCRQILVWPASMIWPSNLTSTAFLTSMHEKSFVGAYKGWSRFKMFSIAGGIMFLWEIVPSYLFTSLGYFSWPAWIAPKNKGVNIVFGGSGGIGLNTISFDWLSITSGLGSPLFVPWFAIVNTIFGYLIPIVIVAPILWGTNTQYTGYLTFSSDDTYDRFGNEYSVDYVTTPEFTLDKERYESYSEVYLSATYLISYCIGFGAITGTLRYVTRAFSCGCRMLIIWCISHVTCFYGRQIVQQLKRSLKEEPDIHARLMSRYPEVPYYWYGITFLVSFAMAVPAVYCYQTELPIWMLIVAILMSAVYTIPIGIITAVTSTQPGLNVIAEMIAGYALPGKPVAMMIFKTFGYISMAQAVTFVGDLKLGHYMKVPPKDMFWAQTISTIWACLVQVAVTAFMFGTTRNLCGVNKDEKVSPSHFICLSQGTFYSASVVFGLIGPGRTFAIGTNYGALNIMFIVGAVLPIPTWYLAKKFPNSWIRLINWPVFFSATASMPPAQGINFTSFFLVGWLFQYYLRRHYFEFWSDYNYIISSAFDCGSAIMSFLVSLILEVPTAHDLAVNNVFNGENLWWGNTVETNTLQGSNTLLLKPPPERGFAPAPNGKWLPNPIASSSSS